MGDNAIKTNEDIQAVIREALGEEIAELREAMQAKGRESGISDADAIADAISRANGKPGRNKTTKGTKFASFARVVMRAQGDREKAIKIAKEEQRQDLVDALEVAWQKCDERVKAMGEATLAGGGALVPQDWASDFLEILHDEVTVMALGARSVPVPRGNLPIPGGDTGVTAYWTGENENITPSEATTRVVNLRVHELACLVPLSNQLIMDSSPAADMFIRDEMVSKHAETLDLAYIRGLGVANSPKGLRYQAAAANVFGATQAGAIATLAEVTSDLVKMMYLVNAALKGKVRRPGWDCDWRAWFFLFSLLDGNGNPVFRDELKAGTLYGAPIKATNQIPNNLGGGTNESEFYFADFDKIMEGDGQSLEIQSSDTAAYWDGSAVQSAFSRNQTVMRSIQRKGLDVRQRGNEISVLTTVKWGA